MLAKCQEEKHGPRGILSLAARVSIHPVMVKMRSRVNSISSEYISANSSSRFDSIHLCAAILFSATVR